MQLPKVDCFHKHKIGTPKIICGCMPTENDSFGRLQSKIDDRVLKRFGSSFTPTVLDLVDQCNNVSSGVGYHQQMRLWGQEQEAKIIVDDI